jgi:hypothetical protein
VNQEPANLTELSYTITRLVCIIILRWDSNLQQLVLSANKFENGQILQLNALSPLDSSVPARPQILSMCTCQGVINSNQAFRTLEELTTKSHLHFT